MTNTIKINKCDNELILFAINEDASDCYEICNIKSGNLNSVDATINLTAGNEASATITENGVGKPIVSTNTFSLPKGKYTFLYTGLNWGGPYNFQFTFNGVNYELSDNPSKPLLGVIWSKGDDNIQFEIA